MEASVRVAKGRDSYVLVLRPNLLLPGVVIVDKFSRVEPKPAPPVAAPSPAAAPIPAPVAVPADGKKAK
jgi:hypothetical protein